MSELRELYQQVIIDHSKNPRNFGALESANRSANGHNPLCGDKVTVHLQTDGKTVQDIRFEGAGCAISTASASMMTEMIKGKSLEEVAQLFNSFHDLVTSDPSKPKVGNNLGKLAVFSGVCEFPMRVKCATLSWHTLQNAVNETKNEKVATTE